jgi:hypothetical protein
MGGPGAVFWMWAAALMGCSVKVGEIVFGQRFGGAMQYIRAALGRVPAAVYALLALFSTLLVSTGFPRADTPFAETPAGEYLMVSWTGGFWAGQLYCDMGIRINSGILIHEVPVLIKKDETTGEEIRDYNRCERYLGEKASHGCIRVQQKKTPEGINEEWLWKNLSDGNKKGKDYTKVIIWDDAGRELGYPDEDLVLYYNAKRDKNYYHSTRACERIKSSSKTVAFTWGELEDKTYRKLLPCPCCNPQLRKSGIDTLNKKNNR